MRHLITTVSIVGLGSIGKRHVKIIKSNFPGVKIIVLRHRECDDSTEELGIYKCVTSIDDALGQNPNLTIISNPASKHIEIAKVLASSGIGLLIEKPISDSSDGVGELIELCSQNNVVLMIGYNLRFLPSLIEFKKLIKSNKIGKIYSVRSEIGQHLPSWRPESDYRSGVSAQNSLGGGALLELSHEIDYLTWIFGKVEWVKAHASKQSDLNIDVEDTALVVLGFVKRGNKALTASLNIDFIRHDTTRKCYVIGEYGTLMWDGINGEVNFFEKDSSQWKNLFSHKPNRYLTYTKEVKSFFASVDSKKTPEITGEDGLIAVKIVEAIKRSSDNNSIVYCN